jgi:D-aminoacyl-tRNA deacylase
VGFDTIHEATHHGPDVETPSVFIEIGSTGEEWIRIDAAQNLVDALVATITNYQGEKSTVPVVFGIGGLHSCSNFNKYSAAGQILLGHVAPTYVLENITKDTIEHAIKRTTLPQLVVVDTKALNSALKSKVLTLLESTPYIKLQDLKHNL